MTFQTPYDIANRALHHLGSPRIATFADNSKAAQEMGFVYDKVRRAELRRHIWRFATRRTALREVTSTTKFLTFGAWASGTAYAAGDIVQASNNNNVSELWISLQGSNTGNPPANNEGIWQEYFGPVTADTYSTTATYQTGELVVTGGDYYLSLTNGNIDNAPASGAPWLALSTQPTGVTIFVPNPNTASQNGATRNSYRLPNGFLRIAAQDPKLAGVNYLAISGGMQWSDFEIEGTYLLTATAGTPLYFRFAADLEDVTQFDDMFCEMLAARMALSLCETFTQSQEKKQQVTGDYDRLAFEARMINAIEVGSTEPLEEGYQVSRQTGANGPGEAMQQNGGASGQRRGG